MYREKTCDLITVNPIRVDLDFDRNMIAFLDCVEDWRTLRDASTLLTETFRERQNKTRKHSNRIPATRLSVVCASCPGGQVEGSLYRGPCGRGSLQSGPSCISLYMSEARGGGGVPAQWCPVYHGLLNITQRNVQRKTEWNKKTF